MRRKPGLWQNHIYARDPIHTAIGRVLAAQYDLAEPLPAPLAALLSRLEQTDGADGTRRVEGGSREQQARRAGRATTQSRNWRSPEAL
jgi:hypothetical protein